LSEIQNGLADIEHHMLHLNNHDEQRLASPNLQERHKRKPLMVVSTTISTSPWYILVRKWEKPEMKMQVLEHSRTSIFDYIGVKSSALDERW
jgi:hypothetical protein